MPYSSVMTGRDEATTIRYAALGQGKKTMVIVPGVALGYVTDVAPALEQVFSDFTDDYTIYVFDVREEFPEGYTLHDACDDLAAVMKRLGLRDTYLYGCSLGGMMSMCIAGRYPELAKRLVIASAVCRANATSDAVFTHWAELALAGECRTLVEDFGRRLYVRTEVDISTADALDEQIRIRFAAASRIMVGIDLTEEVRAIRCPRMLLGSLGDQVMSGEGIEQTAHLLGGEIYLYGPEYPHAVYDEAPDFRARVKAFFEK